MIRARGITKSFNGKTAVDSLSFEVESEIFGLLGPNGAGKTTTLRMLIGILRPDRGEIEVLGMPPSEVRNRIGYLPEERGLYRKLRVMNVLCYLASLKGLDAVRARRNAEYWLERFELGKSSNMRIEELSKGMQQKVQIIAALIHNPDVLILDEPFSGLDAVNIDLLKHVLRELDDKAIVLSTHILHLAEELCDRVLLMNEGRAVAYGSMDDVKAEFTEKRVVVEYRGQFPTRSFKTVRSGTGYVEVVGDVREVMAKLLEKGVDVGGLRIKEPSLEEVFLRKVRRG